MLWVNFRVFDAHEGHSGYEFTWSPLRLLPFSSSSEFHNFHHSNYEGNYASFFNFWDTLFNTNKEYYIFKSKKEQQ